MGASGLASSDFWVIFTARPIFANGQDSQTVATALPCDTVPNNGRPSIGYINFNPQQFQELPNNEAKFQAVLRVGFHEMTHALGFTSSLYDDYRDSRTNNLAVWPPGIVTVTRSTPWGPRPVCETPRVQAFARQHYGCATLTGVGFETEGGPGTELSHWKQRQTGEEYMGGFISPTMYISNLTRALFEDMGWYRSNYSFAEDLPWLRGAGCTATTERCTSQNWPYFCSQVGRRLHARSPFHRHLQRGVVRAEPASAVPVSFAAEPGRRVDHRRLLPVCAELAGSQLCGHIGGTAARYGGRDLRIGVALLLQRQRRRLLSGVVRGESAILPGAGVRRRFQGLSPGRFSGLLQPGSVWRVAVYHHPVPAGGGSVRRRSVCVGCGRLCGGCRQRFESDQLAEHHR